MCDLNLKDRPFFMFDATPELSNIVNQASFQMSCLACLFKNKTRVFVVAFNQCDLFLFSL